MPYDHGKKAGNQGDVVKHVALIAAARHALEATPGKFRYADAYAGRAGSLLKPSGEWKHGIGCVDRAARVHSRDVQDWICWYFARPQLVGGRYPGSALMVSDVAAAAERALNMTMWDTSKAAVKDLKEIFPKQNVVHAPVDPSAKQVRSADFLFIDPPDVARRWPTIKGLMACGRHMLAWIPISVAVRPGAVKPSKAAGRQLDEVLALESVRCTRVLWAFHGRTIGCLLAYRSSAGGIESIRAAVDEVVSLCEWPRKDVEHLS